MCTYVYTYICVHIYVYTHTTKSTICCPHTHDREAIFWNMEHVQITRGHTFRENGFFYPQKLSALSSSSVRGRRLMSSLPQSRLLAELILPRSYRQPQPLWVYEYIDWSCSEDTVSLQSSWPVVVQHSVPSFKIISEPLEKGWGVDVLSGPAPRKDIWYGTLE